MSWKDERRKAFPKGRGSNSRWKHNNKKSRRQHQQLPQFSQLLANSRQLQFQNNNTSQYDNPNYNEEPVNHFSSNTNGPPQPSYTSNSYTNTTPDNPFPTNNSHSYGSNQHTYQNNSPYDDNIDLSVTELNAFFSSSTLVFCFLSWAKNFSRRQVTPFFSFWWARQKFLSVLSCFCVVAFLK